MNLYYSLSRWKRWEYNTLIVLLEHFLRLSALVSLYVTSLWIIETHWGKWVAEGSREERKQRMSALASWPLSTRSLLSSNSSDYKLNWYLKWPYTPRPPCLASPSPSPHSLQTHTSSVCMCDNVYDVNIRVHTTWTCVCVCRGLVE